MSSLTPKRVAISILLLNLVPAGLFLVGIGALDMVRTLVETHGDLHGEEAGLGIVINGFIMGLGGCLLMVAIYLWRTGWPKPASNISIATKRSTANAVANSQPLLYVVGLVASLAGTVYFAWLMLSNIMIYGLTDSGTWFTGSFLVLFIFVASYCLRIVQHRS